MDFSVALVAVPFVLSVFAWLITTSSKLRVVLAVTGGAGLVAVGLFASGAVPLICDNVCSEDELHQRDIALLVVLAFTAVVIVTLLHAAVSRVLAVRAT